ncbi:MAG: Stp1/IreP family PP2C-type Ser/Thr phosphatase [Lachnospiraceae bacterium]|nr:Stp1/IreP family PP2C-type Ser/Thr phosphatase [Lachnospiraceae bacterium]
MRVFSATDVGKVRQVNQDYIFTSKDPVGNLPNLFVVADGMGGHAAGDFASHYGVAALVAEIKKDDNFNPVKIIRNGMTAANAAIFDAAIRDPNMAGMGTTMVAASVAGDYLYIANVGDSRLYVAEDKLVQVTQDHSLIAEMVRLGELEPEDAKHHPDKNIITRAVGTEDTVQVDFFDMKLEKGQVFLLCSDGLSNMLDNEEIFRILTEALRDGNSDPAQQLVDAANEAGGKDNIAAIVVDPFADEVI